MIHVGSADFCLFAVNVLLDDTNISGFGRLATFVTNLLVFLPIVGTHRTEMFVRNERH